MASESNTIDFSLLPPNIIAQIFKLLNFRERLKAARTCRAWYYASCDPLIWRNTRIKIKNKIIRVEDFHRPFGRMILSDIDFNKFTSYSSFFEKFGQHIRELHFNYCILSLQQLYDCLNLTPRLTSLSIEVDKKLFTNDVHFSTQQLDTIKLNSNGVKSFAIVLNKKNWEGVLVLLQMMPHLKNISLTTPIHVKKYVYGTLFDYFDTFDDEINLNRLEIGNLSGDSTVKFLKDFLKIEQKLNIFKLVMGTISGRRFHDYSEYFDQFCKKLSSVRVFSMYSVEQIQLNHLCSNMTGLTELYLTGMHYQNARIIGNLRNLKKLTLNYFQNDYYEKQLHLLGVFPNLIQLVELRLEFAVSPQVLNEICTSCTSLTSLELYRVRTNNFIILFKNLLKLKRLHLIFCEPQFGFTVDYNIANLQLLEELVISSFAPGMTIDLIEQLPNLPPESLLNIRNNLQAGYDDPELEDTYNSVSSLFI